MGFFQIRRLRVVSDEDNGGKGRSNGGVGGGGDDGGDQLDGVMVSTAFGIFVYCAFTVIAGVLSESLVLDGTTADSSFRTF